MAAIELTNTGQFDAIDALAGELSSKLKNCREQKHELENRWVEDLRQYHGRYDLEQERILEVQHKRMGTSEVFVNLTQPRTDAAEARLVDMLFPTTGDPNWGIQPTPNADLVEEALPLEIAPDADPEQLVEDIAKERSEAMAEEINDQLEESHYNACARDAIGDACRIGTGVLKGPVTLKTVRKSWNLIADGVYELVIEEQFDPGVRRVSPFDFFPDMRARRIGDAEFTFERSLMTKTDLRNLVGLPGVIDQQIVKVLSAQDEEKEWASQSSDGADIYQRLREISSVYSSSLKGIKEVWLYSGPVSPQILESVGLVESAGDINPLEVTLFDVTFVDNCVIRISEKATDDESLYSVYNYYESEQSIFGYGIPRRMRAGQIIANKIWRAIIDNAALSVGPQIVVDTNIIEASDNHEAITAFKVWRMTDRGKKVSDAFAVVQIENNQPQLQEVLKTVHELIDEELAMPLLMANSELGNTPPQTATATSMLMNASNTLLRLCVKSWDDNMTVPIITRFYHYNMRYSSKSEIKGDYEVCAKGSTALMVKETQTQSLLALLEFAANPVYAPYAKHRETLAKYVETQRLEPDDLLYTDEEMAKQQAEQPEEPSEADVQMSKIETERMRMEQDKVLAQAQLQAGERDRQLEVAKQRMTAQMDVIKMTAANDQKYEELATRLAEVEAKFVADQQLQANEAAIKDKHGSGL